MPPYTIQLRGVRYCTAEVKIYASGSDLAQELAVKLAKRDGFRDWNESYMQDVMVENVTLDLPADRTPHPSFWEDAQQASAMKEGWCIANIELGIARWGTHFSSDWAAQAFVAHRAILGDELARAAWAHLLCMHAMPGAATDK